MYTVLKETQVDNCTLRIHELACHVISWKRSHNSNRTHSLEKCPFILRHQIKYEVVLSTDKRLVAYTILSTGTCIFYKGEKGW